MKALLIDEQSNDANLDALYNAHSSYMLERSTARGIIENVTHGMKQWKAVANECGISRKEINDFAERIELCLK